MSIDRVAEYRVKPGIRVKMSDFDPAYSGREKLKRLSKDELKERAQAVLAETLAQLADAQELLYADNTHSVLVILQAMDAAGKDGTIKHVMSGVNPQGCRVVSFKQPSLEELDHNFLWRVWKQVPAKGEICIFNRSHYEDVLVVRVHPKLLRRRIEPDEPPALKFWRKRYQDINAFERHLARNGTLILKFFLNVSREEQKRRFYERLDNPEKHWKFSPSDIAERQHWDAYTKAYEDAISATSTKWAPWYIVPADHKWVCRAIVATILSKQISKLKLKHPTVTEEQKEGLLMARKMLEEEG